MNPAYLIAGPYALPQLRKGDRAFCLYRDAEVVGRPYFVAALSRDRIS